MEMLVPHLEAEKMEEAHVSREVEIEAIAPDGLGYGKGNISVKYRRENQEIYQKIQKRPWKERFEILSVMLS